MKIAYTLEQIQQLGTLLNTVEVKGRSNLNALLLALQIVEQGKPVEIEEESHGTV